MKEDPMHPDDDLGARLKVLLDPPPPGIDAVRATATARRSHRRRRRATVAAAAVLLLATGATAGIVATGTDPVPPAAPPNYDRCAVRPGAVPPDVTVTAADPTGTRLAGYRVDPAGARSAETVVVRDGTVTVIPAPGTGRPGTPVAVDRSGTVYGWTKTAEEIDSKVPWVYRAGVTRRLPIPAGYAGAGIDGVNARGDVAGNAYRRVGTTVHQTGVVWPAGAHDSPVVTDPGPEFSFVEVAGIADDGTLVGRAASSPDDMTSYTWRPGGPARRLAEPAGGWSARVSGVNGRWAFGHLLNGAGPAAPTRWNLATGAVETFPDVYPSASVVSPDGVLVVNDPRAERVVVVDAAGGVHQLPTPGGRAVAISTDGRTLVGSAMWTCV
jgi:hypothetical protein